MKISNLASIRSSLNKYYLLKWYIVYLHLSDNKIFINCIVLVCKHHNLSKYCMIEQKLQLLRSFISLKIVHVSIVFI